MFEDEIKTYTLNWIGPLFEPEIDLGFLGMYGKITIKIDESFEFMEEK